MEESKLNELIKKLVYERKKLTLKELRGLKEKGWQRVREYKKKLLEEGKPDDQVVLTTSYIGEKLFLDHMKQVLNKRYEERGVEGVNEMINHNNAQLSDGREVIVEIIDKPKECPECKCKNIELDFAHTDLVCSGCGLLIDPEIKEREPFSKEEFIKEEIEPFSAEQGLVRISGSLSLMDNEEEKALEIIKKQDKKLYSIKDLLDSIIKAKKEFGYLLTCPFLRRNLKKEFNCNDEIIDWVLGNKKIN